MKKIFFLLAVALAIVACGSDSAEEENSITIQSFVGEWVTMNGSLNSATDIMLKEGQYLTTVSYTDLSNHAVVSNEDMGIWAYYHDNNILRMTPNQEFATDYSVVEISANMMKLRNRDLNFTEVYYRVVDTQNVNAGENVTLNWLKQHPNFDVQSITSSNNHTLSVSEEGISAKARGGLVFLTISSATETVVVKVNVQSCATLFSEEVLSNIDAIKAVHGEPDVSGQSGQNMAIVYRQSIFAPSLSAIQYQYDEATREVTRILTLYKEEEVFTVDAEEIKATLYDLGDNLYGENSVLRKNTYVVSPFISEGACYVSYNNLSYFLREMHY